jgi:hypothetical protein
MHHLTSGKGIEHHELGRKLEEISVSFSELPSTPIFKIIVLSEGEYFLFS